MTLTVNQILVICLILVLIGFVVVLAVMAVHAVELIKKTKVLVGDGQELLDNSKSKIDVAGDKIIEAATSVAADTAPAVRAVGATAGGLTAINLLSFAGRALARSGGLFAAASDRRERKKTRRELKRSRKTVKKINRQTKLENKAVKRSKKAARKAVKAEKKAAKRAVKRNRKAAKKAAKRAKKEE